MLKKIIIGFFIFISCFAITYAAGDSIRCSPELQNSLNLIRKIPDAQKLLASIQNAGPISIVVTRSNLSQQFGAYWDPDLRIISINPAAHSSEGELIGSILFELHNASNTSRIDHIDHLASTGKIDRENYIMAMERLEYENSISAAQIADKGIQAGIFPRSARLPTYSSFQEHYYYQKLGGHSAWVGNVFDQLAPRP
mgnify:CR=1 FL=1